MHSRFTSNEIDLIDLIISESKTVLDSKGINYFKRFKVEEVKEFLLSLLSMSSYGSAADEIVNAETMRTLKTMNEEGAFNNTAHMQEYAEQNIHNLVDAPQEKHHHEVPETTKNVEESIEKRHYLEDHKYINNNRIRGDCYPISVDVPKCEQLDSF